MIDVSRFARGGKPTRPVVHETLVAASPMEVFDTLTTAEGVSGFLGVRATVELAVGGTYELLFGEDLPEGQQGSEGCKILAYVPGEMVAFSWNSPPTLPEIRDENTWVVITLRPHDDGTHVRLVHTGMPEGGDWEENRDYFGRAWGNVLAALAEYFVE
jgi:uncharacterized protein YndB with AHSA1/START domain